MCNCVLLCFYFRHFDFAISIQLPLYISVIPQTASLSYVDPLSTMVSMVTSE